MQPGQRIFVAETVAAKRCIVKTNKLFHVALYWNLYIFNLTNNYFIFKIQT